MKKLMLLVLLILLLFSTIGCNSTNGDNIETGQPLDVDEEIVDQTDEVEVVTEPCPISFSDPKYIRNSIGDEEFHVQLTNNSDHPVKEVHFAVAYWDKDNLPIKVQFGYDEYTSFIYDNAMTPGETTSSSHRWSIYNESGKDIANSVIVVERVIFFDGEDWVNTNYMEELNQYVGKIRSSNGNNQEAGLPLEEQVEDQPNLQKGINEPCPIIFSEPQYIRNSIGDEEFHVQLTNTSDRSVKEVHFAVAYWDKDNLPIKVQFGYDEYTSFKYDNAMTSGETTPSGYAWSIYNESGKDIAHSVIVVERVIFFEGEDWVNPKYLEELDQYVGKIRQ